MREWLDVRTLGQILGLKPDTVKHRIYRGVYTQIKKDTSGRFGKKRWLINILDKNIPEDVRDLFERQVTKFLGIPSLRDVDRLTAIMKNTVEEVHKLAVSLEEAVSLLHKTVAQQAWITKRLK